MSLPSIAFKSATGGSNLPVTFAHEFVEGEVPNGSFAVLNGIATQCNVMNRWPDGSLKIAIMTAVVTLTAGVALSVPLVIGTPASGTAVTADALTSGVTATIAAGGLGSATFSGVDWSSPFVTHVTGPLMSSWIYRKSVGSDAHLVGWLEVRVYAGGQVEVLPWVENGFLFVAGPTSKSATYTFTLGGTQRTSQAIDLPSRCRSPLVASTVSHWVGTDPGVIVRHDAAYMMATKLVPTYTAVTPSNGARVTAQVSTYVPLQQGNWTYPSDGMAGTGYSPPIGLIPEHDVLYLTCTTSDKPWTSIQLNAYGAGRYSIHYRDENTNRPIAFSSWPRLSVNSSGISQYPLGASGTGGRAWDIPHHPSMGYMAYLVTGRFYFLEQCQFVATRNYLGQPDNVRSNSDGIFQSASGANTERGAAWALRSLAQAATITPTGTPLASEFVTSFEKNVDWHHARYVAQPSNPQGWVQIYNDDSGPSNNGSQGRCWMQDFFTAATGYAKAMKPAISTASAARLTAFFAWKAQSIIGRLGGNGSTEYPFVDAAVYNVAIAPADGGSTPPLDWATGTGPWYATWRDLYNATNTYNNYTPAAVGNALRGGNFPETTSYWGNLLPAISYAVQHGVTGAQAAFDRLTGASNWSTFASGLNDNPVWGVMPAAASSASNAVALTISYTYQVASGGTIRAGITVAQPSGLPAWAEAAPLWTWTEIPGSRLSDLAYAHSTVGSGGKAARVYAWCGAALKRQGSEYLMAAAGGHADYGGNEVTGIVLNSDTPTWTLRRGPSAANTIIDGASAYTDLRRSATHTYYGQYVDNVRNRLIITPAPGMGIGGLPPQPENWPYQDQHMFAFDLSTNDWMPPESVTPWPSTGDFTACLVVPNPLTGDLLYSRNYDGGRGWKLNAAANTWAQTAQNIWGENYASAALDTTRMRFLKTGAYTLGGPSVRDFNTGEYIPVTFGGLGHEALQCGSYSGMVYDEANDTYLHFTAQTGGIRVRRVRASDFFVDEPAITGSIANRPNGIHNAVQYAPELKGVVILNAFNEPMKYLRTSL